MIKTVNVTLKLQEEEIPAFESWLRMQADVVDLKILPEDRDLYENDKHYKKLCNMVKKAKETKETYYNNKRM